MATKKKSRTSRGASSKSTPRVPVAKTYKLYINGRFPRSESGRYFKLSDRAGNTIANVCRGSRKDFRDSVVAARTALDGWQSASAYLRGQIVYRAAEMLEGRRAQFVEELALMGVSRRAAEKEVDQSIDRLIYFAGWADKYQQVFSSVNPVASSHFDFSVLEPMGVVGLLAPERSGLLGLIANLAPVIVGGNSCVVLASESLPLTAISFAEVLHSSDVPPGVVNILTGHRDELALQFASHMDVNAVVVCDEDEASRKEFEQKAAVNIKRVIARDAGDWSDASTLNPYWINDSQEVKTTWHPVGA